MKMLAKLVSTVIGLALLCALAMGIYFAIRYLGGALAQLDAQVATVTATASVVALACAAIVAGGRSRSEADGTRQLRAERMAVYQALIDVVAEAPQPPEKLVALRRLLILSGSVEVICAWQALEVAASAEFPMLFAKLIEKMRRDLGVSSRNLKDEHVVRFLTGHQKSAS